MTCIFAVKMQYNVEKPYIIEIFDLDPVTTPLSWQNLILKLISVSLFCKTIFISRYVVLGNKTKDSLRVTYDTLGTCTFYIFFSGKVRILYNFSTYRNSFCYNNASHSHWLWLSIAFLFHLLIKWLCNHAFQWILSKSTFADIVPQYLVRWAHYLKDITLVVSLYRGSNLYFFI